MGNFNFFYAFLHELFAILTTFWQISEKKLTSCLCPYCAVGIHIVMLVSLLMLVLLLASLYYFWHPCCCSSAFCCRPCDVPIVSAAVGLTRCCCWLHCFCKDPCFWWHPYFVCGPVIALIPACVPAVVSSHDIAIILNGACCWRYCCCLCHCCCLHPDCGRHSCCCWHLVSKTSPKCSFSIIENERFRLVVKNGSINSGTWWFPVAGLSAIAAVPGVPMVLAFLLFLSNMLFLAVMLFLAFLLLMAFLLLLVFLLIPLSYFSWWLYILDCRMRRITLSDYQTMAIRL